MMIDQGSCSLTSHANSNQGAEQLHFWQRQDRRAPHSCVRRCEGASQASQNSSKSMRSKRKQIYYPTAW